MSGPPRVIHIKRKLDEEAPVSFLQLEGTKRNRSGSDWYYQRKIAGAKHATRATPIQPSQAPHDAKPVIHTSRPGDELASPNRLRQLAAPVPHTIPAHAPEQGSAVPPGQTPGGSSNSRATRPSQEAFEPRRFHMSRASMGPAASQSMKAGISKKARYGTVVFVERSKKSVSQKALDAVVPGINAPHGTEDVPRSTTESGDVEMTDETSYKKPGRAKQQATPKVDIESQRLPMPVTPVSRNENMEQISADMNQWVMHEIGLNLASMEQTSASKRAPPDPNRTPSKFRPKAPAKRFAERHPELSKELDGDGDNEDEAMTETSDLDDSEYIIDEYELVPADMVQAAISPEKIGILGFDTEEDVNVFFAAEDDSEDELDDEEDENAENHYTADYPEDEVDSEDEFDRHAYAFRNGNASDEEEFDNMYYSGDDDDAGESYLAEAGKEKQRDDDLFQASIRRYIRHHGAN